MTLWWPLTHTGTDQPQACMGSPILNTLPTAPLPHSFWVACPRAPHLRALLHALRVSWAARWSNLPVNPKGKQPWIFTGRNDSEAEAPILWPTDVKRQIFGKDPDAGNDWGQEEKGCQRIWWLIDITNSMNMNLSKLQETVKDREDWHAATHGISKSQTWLGDWTNKQTKKGKEMNKSNSKKKKFPQKSLIVYSEKHIERGTMPGKVGQF